MDSFNNPIHKLSNKDNIIRKDFKARRYDQNTEKIIATMDLTLLYILFMFSVILFIVYFDYMLSIVRLSLYSSIRSYNAHLEVQWVSGQHCVSIVLIRCLPTNAPYIPGHVIDRGCETPVKFFVVHSPNIGQVGPGYEGRLALFLIFLSNVPYVEI
jgi:hypothetical protein